MNKEYWERRLKELYHLYDNATNDYERNEIGFEICEIEFLLSGWCDNE